MGTSQSQSLPKSNINLQNWKEIQPTEYMKSFEKQNFYQTYANIFTKQVVHRYKIQSNNSDNIVQYYQALNWRKNKKNIVQTSYIIQERFAQQGYQNKPCCGQSMRIIYVCIEQIIIRLSAIKDIPYPQNLYFFISCLNGFQDLFQLFGYFQINQDMVCIDKDGKVKVWINANLSQNKPIKFQKIFKHKFSFDNEYQVSQSQLVKNIVKMICKNTDAKSQPKGMEQYLANQIDLNKLTFKNCKKYVIQYAEEFRTIIPSKFASIIQILNQGDNSKKNNSNSERKGFSSRKKYSNEERLKMNQNEQYHKSKSKTSQSPMPDLDQNHILYGKNYKNNYLHSEQSLSKRLHTSNLDSPQGNDQNQLKLSQKQQKNDYFQDYKSSQSQKIINEHLIKDQFTSSQNSPNLSINKSSMYKLNQSDDKFSFMTKTKYNQEQNKKITFSYAIKENEGVGFVIGSKMVKTRDDNLFGEQFRFKITQSNMLGASQKTPKFTESNFIADKNSNLNKRTSVIREQHQEQSNQNSFRITPRETQNLTPIQKNNPKNYQPQQLFTSQQKKVVFPEVQNFRDLIHSSKNSIKIKATQSQQYDQATLLSPTKKPGSKIHKEKVIFKDDKNQYQLDLEIAQDLRKINLS